MSSAQKEIYDWSTKTFGYQPPLNNAIRLSEESLELIKALTHVKDAGEVEAIKNECADIYIFLAQVAEGFYFDLNEAVKAKMEVNKARAWRTDKHGFNYHVPELPQD